MPTASLLLALLLGIQVVISDLYARRVSNRWLLGVLAGAAAAMLLLPVQSTVPAAAFSGLLIGLLSLLPFYVIRWMGAGDVKLFAVLGFVLGWKALLPLWIGASLLAGAHALVVICTPRLMGYAPSKIIGPLQSSQHWLSATTLYQGATQARQGRKGIPYAAYLGIATLVMVFMRTAHA